MPDKYSIPVTPERIRLREELTKITNHKLRDECYLNSILPEILDDFAALPLYNAPQDFRKPRFLVSVLGLSWQPSVLTARWVKPEKMLVIGSKESVELECGGLDISSMLFKHAGLTPLKLTVKAATGDLETDLYRFVKDFMTDCRCDPRDMAVEMTGGKKTMSAAAALAGFILGAPLLYVDYLAYSDRRPLPFSEYLSYVRNPLEVFGDIEYEKVLRDFDNGNYQAASTLCRELENRLYDNREPQTLRKICDSMDRAVSFNFVASRRLLSEALEDCKRFGRQGKWNWFANSAERLEEFHKRLEELVRVPNAKDLSGRLPIVWFGLAQSRAMIERGLLSQAALLIYATLERVFKYCLIHYFELNPDKPNFDLISVTQRNSAKKLSESLYGDFRESMLFKGELSFSNSMLLLEAFASCDSREQQRQCPVRIDKKLFQQINRESGIRHGSQYSHGLYPGEPGIKSLQNYYQLAMSIVSMVVGEAEAMKSVNSFALPKW